MDLITLIATKEAERAGIKNFVLSEKLITLDDFARVEIGPTNIAIVRKIVFTDNLSKTGLPASRLPILQIKSSANLIQIKDWEISPVIVNAKNAFFMFINNMHSVHKSSIQCSWISGINSLFNFHIILTIINDLDANHDQPLN